MTRVTHFDLDLHQIDVKTTFLNGYIDKKFICKIFYSQLFKFYDLQIKEIHL